MNEITYIIQDELKNVGFNTETNQSGVIVSLNRGISITEVEIALNFLVDRKYMTRTSYSPSSVFINTRQIQKDLF